MIDYAKRCAGRVSRRRGRAARGAYRRLWAERLESRALLAANQFAVIGDYGDDTPFELAVATLVKSWEPAFIITVGDNNYDSGKAETIDPNIGKYYQEYIGNYVGAYGPGSATDRFFPTLGNHDWHAIGAQPYLDYFTLPGNERYYDFVQGPIHFFAVDADDSEPDGWTSTSVQGQWLQAGLAASTSDFNVVYFHQSPYSSGVHGSLETMQWPFKEWGANVVFTGHDHDYERLIVDGFPYFIAGTGGRSLRDFLAPIPGSEVRYSADFGAMLVTFDDTKLVAEFYSVTGGSTLIDRYTILADTPPAEPVTVSFQDGVASYSGTRDARIRSNNPTANLGNATTLGVDGAPDAATLIQWDLGQIPPGSAVQSATITLNVTEASIDTFEIYAVQRDWVEAEVTWIQAALGSNWSVAGADGAGDRGTTVLGTINAPALGIQQFTLNADGIAEVQRWVDNPGSNHGLVVQDYLAAIDGLTMNSSEVGTSGLRPRITVTYLRPGTPNQSPVVDAGPDGTVDFGLAATLDGTVDDDGLPLVPGAVAAVWTQVSGPGDVAFADSSAVDTTATFSLPGTYVLRLTADDGALSASDDVTVAVTGSTPAVSIIQAESFRLRDNSSDHAWWIISGESPGVGTLTGATGPYLQSLTDAALDSGNVNAAPAAPYVEYEVSVSPGGVYALDLLSAGVNTSGDSVWVQVPTGTLANAENNPVVGAGNLALATGAARFTWRNAGQWDLPAGRHTIRVSMRESGAAVDALRLERLTPAPLAAALAELGAVPAEPANHRNVQQVVHRSRAATAVPVQRITLIPHDAPRNSESTASLLRAANRRATGPALHSAAVKLALSDRDSLDELLLSAIL